MRSKEMEEVGRYNRVHANDKKCPKGKIRMGKKCVDRLEARSWMKRNFKKAGFDFDPDYSLAWGDAVQGKKLVADLYKIGSPEILVEESGKPDTEDYADGLLIRLPKNREKLKKIINKVGQHSPDEFGIITRKGKEYLRIWWD